MAKTNIDKFLFLKQPKAHITAIHPLNKLMIGRAFEHDPWQIPARAHDVFKKEITEDVF